MSILNAFGSNRAHFLRQLLAAQRLVDPKEQEEGGEETEIENWSSTHAVKTKAYLQPESVEEVRHASAQAISFAEGILFSQQRD